MVIIKSDRVDLPFGPVVEAINKLYNKIRRKSNYCTFSLESIEVERCTRSIHD